MRLAVIGSRNFRDYDLLYNKIVFYFGDRAKLIVSGGAKGADALAEVFAKQAKIPTKIYEPDWDKFGKAAGMIRNQKIIEGCDAVICFWDGESKGSKNSLSLAKKMKKDTVIVYYKNDR
jgi:uncharacterized phage-like protein YoqJ